MKKCKNNVRSPVEYNDIKSEVLSDWYTHIYIYSMQHPAWLEALEKVFVFPAFTWFCYVPFSSRVFLFGIYLCINQLTVFFCNVMMDILSFLPNQYLNAASRLIFPLGTKRKSYWWSNRRLGCHNWVHHKYFIRIW